MNMIKKLPKILDNAQFVWEHTIPSDIKYDTSFDSYSGINKDSKGGQIILGDNLAVSKTLYAGICAETITPMKLIYMDPPFFTKTSYVNTLSLKTGEDDSVKVPLEAFSDKWKSEIVHKNLAPTDEVMNWESQQFLESREDDDGENEFARYLTMLSARIIASREMLGHDGSLWIHLDHHAAHYVKVIADEIFGGPEHLLNEVIWNYKSGGSTKKRFARKHDTLLFYAKNPKMHFFNIQTEKSYNRGKKPYRFKGVKEYRDENGWYTLVNMRDVWQIDMVGRTSSERTGYATQKPEALLERIVTSCTEKGDWCMDLFGGSGTLASVAEKNSRSFISIDNSPIASIHTEKRLVNLGASFEILSGTPDDESLIDINMNVSIEDTPDKNKKLAVIKLTSYSLKEMPVSDILPLGHKYSDIIAKAVETNLPQLIGSLSIGTDIEDNFCARAVRYDSDVIEIILKKEEAEKIIDSPELLAIRVVDVFGNSFSRRLSKDDFK